MTIEPSPNLRLRLLATAWTTAVAFVLLGASTLLILSGLLGQSGGGPFDLIQSLGLFLALPSLAAGASGFLFGWRLLDPTKAHHPSTAIGIGLVTGVLAYAVLGCLYAVVGVASDQLLRPAKPIFVPLIALLLPLFTVIFGIYGTGWLTLPVAGVAGYLLSRRYRQR